MRALSIIVVWLTALTLALTVYSYGMVQHYWYDKVRGAATIYWAGRATA